MPHPSAQSDTELIAQILSSPDEGMKALFAKHGPLVRALIRRHGFLPEDCEEIFQELSLRLVKDDFKLLRDWDPAKCPLKGYLAVVAESACVNFFRSAFHRYTQRKRDGAEFEGDASSILSLSDSRARSPLEHLTRLHDLGRVRHHLEASLSAGKVNDQDRAIFELRLGGLSWKEIGESVGVSPQFARNRMQRLKGVLRQGLHRDGSVI